MGFGNNLSSEDKENARLDRQRKSNPAESDPGMADEFDWDSFDTPSGSSGDSWTGGSGGGDSLGGGGFGDSGGFGGGGFGGFGGDSNGFGGSWGGNGGNDGGFGGFGGSGGQDNKDKDLEDKLFEGTGKFFKGFFEFVKDFTTSMGKFNYMNQLKMGRLLLVTSGVVAVTGVLLALFGLGSFGLQLIVGGVASLGIGVWVFMPAYDKFVKNGGVDNLATHIANDNTLNEKQGFFDSASDFPTNDAFDNDSFAESKEPAFSDFGVGGDDTSFTDDEFPMDEDEEYPMDEDEDDDYELFDDDEEDSLPSNVGDDMTLVLANRESALERADFANGMLTRQYLYENISSCLTHVNKYFDTIRVIDEDSEEFDDFDGIIQRSADLFKPNGNDIDIPYLVYAEERIFYYMLEINRVKWLKDINKFRDEIVKMCAYDRAKGTMNESIYGVADAVGDKIYLKIMKGETAMVSIKDAYQKIRNDVLDTSNFMPVVIGVDTEGAIVWRDFKSIEAILVTGMPRSGKTWTVVSILQQMAMYLKPSELHFYILDPKEGISDYKAFKIPHVRKFVSTDEAILQELRHVVKVEGPRRQKIIGDAGFVNIWDYRKKNPDVDMPLLYVVIDEVITLAERMDANTKDEFNSLLLELVSRLPALGIRIFMIPHVVKDQVIKKSITDLIPCRISVRGDEKHIESSVGVKGFKHQLVHQGDMAVRFNNDKPIFVHSSILAPSNEGNHELFDFMTKFWKKLDEEGFKGSLKWQEETGFSASRLVSSQANVTSESDTVTVERVKPDITYQRGSNESDVKQEERKLTPVEVNELLSQSNNKADTDDVFNLFD